MYLFYISYYSPLFICIKHIKNFKVESKHIAELVDLLKDKKINSSQGIEIFNKISKHELTGNTVLVDDHIDNVVNHVEYNNASGIIFNYMDLDYIKERAIHIDGKYQKISYANDYETLLKMIHRKVAMRKK